MADEFNIAVIMSLVDQFSGPLQQAVRHAGDVTKLQQHGQAMIGMGNQMQAAGIMMSHTGGQIMDGLSGLVAPAIAFEEAMADVRKVVDFETPKQFAEMGHDIMRMSTELPLTADGIAQIVAAAGQSGIARDELSDFAETAGQMATAFDISPDAAGSTMAAWRAAMNMTQSETALLADAVNHLSNNLNATASDLAMVVTRMGAVAKESGLAAGQTAALGAALLSSGAAPEIASTAMKNFLASMTDGAAATGRQRDALAALGLEAETLAQSMQVNAAGTMMEVMESLQALPADRRLSIAGMLFGEESKAAILPLLTNLENLRQAFGLIADETSYAGSMQHEFDVRAGTTANTLVLFNNQVNALKATLGTELLPAINELASGFGRIVSGMMAFSQQHPLLTKIGLSITAIVGSVLFLSGLILQVAGAFTVLKGVMLAFVVPKVVVALLASLRISAMALAMEMFTFGPAFAAASSAVWGFTAALLANPITWIVAGVVALGAAVWLVIDNWSQISGFFQGLWADVRAAFEDGLLNGVLHLLSMLNPVNLLTQLVNWGIEALFGVDLSAVGQAWAHALIAGIKSGWSLLVQQVQALASDLVPDWLEPALGFSGEPQLAAARMAAAPAVQMPQVVQLDLRAQAQRQAPATVTVSAPMTISISGSGAEQAEAFARQLDEHKDHVARLVREETERSTRISFRDER